MTDTGKGIPDHVRPQLFEPFFTTKSPGKGTGLGLASVYGVAEQSGGFIEMNSRVGEVRATVLLAEDEGAVRTFVAAVLRQLGYQVLEAESGEAALALSQGHPDAIELLLSDVVMPGMNGPQLAIELEKARPGIRVVLMSGYAGDALAGLGVQANHFAMLLKPFGSDALARIVREALTEPSRR